MPIPEKHSRRSRTCTVSRIGRSGNARDMAGVLLSIAESLFPHHRFDLQIFMADCRDTIAVQHSRAGGML
jgi:hypothetical protein